MLTWFTLWPFMTIPFLLPFLLGILPLLDIRGYEFGGPLVRQYFVNNMASILPYDQAALLVRWFTQADMVQELSLHALISLNVGLFFYPLFYAIGTLAIRVTAWRVTGELAQSQTLLNRR